MLRCLLMICPLLVLATTGALATTPATWQGAFIVTSVTSACANDTNLKKGKTYLGVFRPKIAPTDPNTAFLVLFSHAANLVTVNSTAIPTPNSGPYTGIVVTPLAQGGVYNGGSYVLTSVTPTTITTSTPQITIAGSINRTGNIPNCTVGFKASFFLEP